MISSFMIPRNIVQRCAPLVQQPIRHNSEGRPKHNVTHLKKGDGLTKSCEIKIEGIALGSLESYCEFIARAADEFKIPLSGLKRLSGKYKQYTIHKAPFVHAKHRSHFIQTSRKRQYTVYNTSDETRLIFLKYILQHAPAGVFVVVKDYEQLTVSQLMEDITTEDVEDIKREMKQMLIASKAAAEITKGRFLYPDVEKHRQNLATEKANFKIKMIDEGDKYVDNASSKSI